MSLREMDWPPRFGLDHPTWPRPTCFFYRTANEARAALVKVYGEDSGHVVIRMERVEHHES